MKLQNSRSTFLLLVRCAKGCVAGTDPASEFTVGDVTKQWMANWPYIAIAVFRIVQNHGEKSYFHNF